MTNELRAFALKLSDTHTGDETVSEFLGINPMHAAFLAGVNVGINMMNHPMAQIFGATYVDGSMQRFLNERDVSVVADLGVLTPEQVSERLAGKFGSGEPEKGPEAVDPEEEFDFEAFLNSLIDEIDDDSL